MSLIRWRTTFASVDAAGHPQRGGSLAGRTDPILRAFRLPRPSGRASWLIAALIFLLTSRLHFRFRAHGRRTRIVVLRATGRNATAPSSAGATILVIILFDID
jgi:hypothetical protein